MIDIDRYKEILDTLSRNKTRSFLTGFGVFWGIFMLVTLMGGSQGLKESMEHNFEGFATNTAFIWAQPTTKPYAGFKKGRLWAMEQKDVERLKEQVPELDVISPLLMQSGKSAVYNDKKANCSLKGIEVNYQRVAAPKMHFGRFINEMDIQQNRKICVMGKKIYKNLFPQGGDPIGQKISIDKVEYTIVGVDYSASNMNIGGSSEETVFIPINVLQQVYGMGKTIHLISVTGQEGVVMSNISNKMRGVIARSHHIDPTDEQGIMVFNTEVLFGMMDNLFKGVNWLTWLVGIGTLLAGAIGVSNIMMVTVKERTTEIGIRRAIGATPNNILVQIVSESIILTTIAGMSGILLAVIILQFIEMGNTEDGIIMVHYQISFWYAIGATLLLNGLGIIAGLAPAYRAMSIKPVDAMRDE
ncbi:MAG: ABC transporter permease [Prevotella sp.]|nr:ABC transporter permease [Prevotella sp.]MDY3853256.1 ABC transporter permease [Prevotella sp.]